MFFIVSPFKMVARGLILLFVALVLAGVTQDLVHERNPYAVLSALACVATALLGVLSTRNGLCVLAGWFRVNFGSRK